MTAARLLPSGPRGALYPAREPRQGLGRSTR